MVACTLVHHNSTSYLLFISFCLIIFFIVSILISGTSILEFRIFANFFKKLVQDNSNLFMPKIIKIMLQEYLKLNKNILIAFTASIIISAIIAQLLSGQTDYLNATYTTIADYVVYFSVFSFLFYLDNRKKYVLESGKTDTVKLKHDLKKLITSLGIAEIIYTIARGLLQYYFLTINYDPYMASIISQSISTIIYMAVLNFTVKITRLYRDEN